MFRLVWASAVAASLLATTVMSKGIAADTAQQAPEILVVIIHHPGPAWQAGVPFKEQSGLQGHIDHYREMLKNGTLQLGGPFLDDSGGMMISIAGASLEELKTFAQGDPAVKSGLLTADVKPWLIGMHQ